jgi:hypothetical protein
LVLLTATTLGCGLLAWRQYNELVELRASALDRGERANLQKRIWDLEKLNRSLQERAAGTRGGAMAGTDATGGPDESGDGRRPSERGGRGDPRGRGDGGMQQAAALRELMAKPEVQAMLNLQQKAGIESRYAPLFKRLNLSAVQAEQLTALLAERGTTRQDVFAAAQEQGINPRTNPEAFRKLLADAQDGINVGIKSIIGESGFAQLQNFEQTGPQRAVVGELQQRLSYTATPLSAEQSEQLVQILARNTPARPPNADAPPPGPPPVGFNPGRPMPFDGPPGGPTPGTIVMPGVIESAVRMGGAPISPAAVAEAQVILSPPQAAALQQMQQLQQGQQQLQQVFRDTLAPGPRAPGRGDSAPPAGGSGAPSTQNRRPGG